MSEAMIDAIDTLPDQQRTVIQLLYVEGFTMRETGTIMKIGKSSVHRILHKALHNLRTELSQ